MTQHGRPSPLRPLAPIVALLAAIALSQAGAPAAVACSCVEPQPMAAYAADPGASVLTGVPGALVARGVPVQVTGWFKGPGAARVIWLSAGSFGGQSAACQRTPPTVGRELILVLYMPEDGSDPSGSICTPMAETQSEQGRQMFADAVATFGPAIVPSAVGPAGGSDPLDPAGLLAATAVIALGAGILALVVAGLRRRDQRLPRR